MPGKWDYGSEAAGTKNQSKYFPGDKEGLSWNDGWLARYALVPRANNPKSELDDGPARQAWFDGWDEADANTAGEQRMPATSGPPGALPP